MLDIASLTVGMRVRVQGMDENHAAALTDVRTSLPPVVVHASTMTVIDGAHRLHAARAQGQTRIEAVLVEGDVADAFVLAVGLNARHGLPLSRADRRMAVARLLQYHPEWSDRRIAMVVGVSPKTVGAVRKDPTEELPQSTTRIGLDGRTRRVDTADDYGRRGAGSRPAEPSMAQARSSRPDTPIGSTSLAPEAGALAAIHALSRQLQELREQLETSLAAGPAGHTPTPPCAAGSECASTPSASLGTDRGVADPQPPSPAHTADLARVIESLLKDPSVRGSEAGRTLLRLLLAHPMVRVGFEEIALAVPAHRRHSLAEVARKCGREWLLLASSIAGSRPQ